ncbi:MAG: hypothetical protein CL610_30310 [Anaerolineaceae bacterium]|nr:hypothetical protein [Anaerolineaceae bacterium]
MTASLQYTLRHELREVIARHLAAIGHYINFNQSPNDQIPDGILLNLERLSDICQGSPDAASAELYKEACAHLADVEAFLKHMNQQLDAEFEATHIGQIWRLAVDWRREAGQRFQVTLPQVWKLIAPVVPDCLDEMGNGLYEAKWWKPVPVMDIEILQYTEGIHIHGQPYQPKHLPGGLAVRFSVSETD